MTDKPHTFIFDVGKTHIKGYLLDNSGYISHQLIKQNNSILIDGLLCIDIEKQCDILFSMLKEMVGKNFSIHAIQITTHGAAAVLLDEHDVACLPVLDYECNIPKVISQTYDTIRPDFALTLSPKLPQGLNLGRQLYFLQHRFPQAFKASRHLLMLPQYFAWRLSGVKAIEATSLGCHTDLWEPLNKQPSSLIARLHLEHALPSFADHQPPIGCLSKDVVLALGLSQDCKVYAGLHDSNASLLPALRYFGLESFAAVSSGTWIITMLSGFESKTHGGKRSDIANHHLVEEKDMFGNLSVDNTLIQTARFMGGREFANICRLCDTDIASKIEWADIMECITASVFAYPSFSDTPTGPFFNHKSEITDKKANGAALGTIYLALMIDYELSLFEYDESIKNAVFSSLAHKNPFILDILGVLRPHTALWQSHLSPSTVYGAWMAVQNPSSFNLPPEQAPRRCKSLEVSHKQRVAILEYANVWRDTLYKVSDDKSSKNG